MSRNQPNWDHQVEYSLELDMLTVDGIEKPIKVDLGTEHIQIGCTAVSFDAIKKIYGDLARRVHNKGFCTR